MGRLPNLLLCKTMPFNSLSFLIFFAVVLCAYRCSTNWRVKKGLLLFFSQIFYAAWNPPFIILLWITTVVNWWLARQMNRESSQARRKAYLVISLISSLGLLSYFKYGGFLLENFVAIVSLWGVDFNPMPFNSILPIGISFYTFHALSYTIDTYRRLTVVTASLSDFALYMSFFPQLVAGPIVRANHFLPQLLANRSTTSDQLGWGLILVIFGLFQKTVLADAIFAPVVDQLYMQPATASGWDAWAGVLAFSGQIFCDFSGYSTCAIGLALCFGLHFPENFRAPYGAIGFSDFWRRWHISLSSWLRDYLYVPMGGGRGSTFSKGRALILTMLLGGLWHGASWMFLLWGGMHAGYLMLERLTKRLAPTLRRHFSDAGLAIATFLVITLTWIPFRAHDQTTAQAVVSALFRTGFPSTLPSSLFASLTGALGIMFLHITNRDRNFRDWFLTISRTTQTTLLGMCLIGIFLVSGGEPRGFIYFQF